MTLQVPAIVVAYIMHMNGIDSFDYIWFKGVIIKNEKRVTTSMFSFVSDAFALSAHTILHVFSNPGDCITDAATMKRKILTKHFSEYVEYKQQSMTLIITISGCFLQKIGR